MVSCGENQLSQKKVSPTKFQVEMFQSCFAIYIQKKKRFWIVHITADVQYKKGSKNYSNAAPPATEQVLQCPLL